MKRPLASIAAVALVACALAWPPPAMAADTSLPCSPPASGTYIDQEPAIFGQLGIPAAQALNSGKGVVVAVVDSGVNRGNPHLSGALVAGYDLTNKSADSAAADTYGHGTMVAALIAARPVKGSGLLGIAPQAKIMPVRIYHDFDAGTNADIPVAATAAGINWAADHGATIIVVPQSAAAPNDSLRDAVRQATDKGALVVASAGNAADANQQQGESLDSDRYPASYDEVLSVTAVNAQGVYVAGSTFTNSHVDIAVPAQNVLTAKGKQDCYAATDSVSTSYAAGYAAGVAALVAAAHPHETPAQWVSRLTSTASRPPGEAGGEREQTGAGVIAPYAAINAVSPRNPRPTPPPAPSIPVPVPPPDRTPALRAGVTVVVGATAVIFLGLMLGRKLKGLRERGRNRRSL